MKRKNFLFKKQKKLRNEFVHLGPFLEGSIGIVKRICGTSTCRCRKDQNKKHPAMFLTWKENKITKTLYIPVKKHKEAIVLNNNYKKLKKLIRQLSDIQKKFIAAK
jgi:hypothetical protein